MKKARTVISTSVQMPEPVQDRGTGVQSMPAGKFFGLAVHLARQLPEGDDRAGERHGTDEDAEKDLDLEDGDLGPGLVRQHAGKASQGTA
jgi:hypothetical protein